MIGSFNGNYIKNIFISLLTVIFLNRIFEVFISFDNYINLNELLINYQGGFLRRGLLGQVAFYFYENHSINPIIFFSIIFSIANLIFFILFLKLIEKYKNNFFLYFSLLLSPATLMFTIFDSINFFNNQIFLVISILLHSFFAQKYLYQINKYRIFFLFLILPIILLNIFQYDPQILTLSSHLFITYYVVSKSKPKSYSLFLLYLILIIPILLIVMNNGSLEQLTALEKMKRSLIENFDFIINTHPESISMMSTNDLGGNLNLKFGAMIKIFGIYFDYDNKIYLLFSILLTIIFFVVMFFYYSSKNIYIIEDQYKSLLVLTLFALLLLFLFITDFGRSIHIYLLHMLSILFLFNKDVKNEKKYNDKLNIIQKSSFVIILILYCNVWTLPHHAGWVTIFNPKQPIHSSYSSYTNELKKISFNIFYYTDKYLITLPKAEFMKKYIN